MYFGTKIAMNPCLLLWVNRIRDRQKNVLLKDISRRENLLWSFLLMGGDLKQTDKRRDATTNKMYYTLSIPNLEVKTVYVQIIE